MFMWSYNVCWQMLEGFLEISCPSNVQDEWHRVLQDALKQRVDRIVRLNL